MLWIVGIAGFIMNVGAVLFALWKSPTPLMKEKGIVYAGSLYFARLLVGGVLLSIIYHLKKFIKTVKQGDPFEKRNPGWIRRIAYGVFAWMPLQILATFMVKGFSEAVEMENFINLLLRDFMWPLFLGTVILVIARAFETGVKMQQDQSLTI